MKFLDIAQKDLYQIFKDWKPAIFLVVAPILFTLMFGFMFGGFTGPNSSSDNRLPVLVAGIEQDPISTSLLAHLQRSSVIQVETSEAEQTRTDYKTAVTDGDFAAVILLPESFSTTIKTTGVVSLDVILDENSNAGVTVQQEIQSTVKRLQSAADAAALAIDAAEDAQGTLDEAFQESLYAETFEKTLTAWETPPVVAEENQTRPDAEETSEENAFAQSLPGMMAQFAIAGLIGAAEIIVQERKSRALDRLKTTAVSRFEILAGHWLAMFAMIFLQFIVMISFGQIFLRLDFFSAPLATLSLAVAACTFVASLGLLIGILAKLPEQTAVYALIPMFLFAGLGGAWMPLELLSESVRTVAKFTPVAWIMIGFKDILLRGAQFTDVRIPVLMLIGFALVFSIPAVILFYKKN